MEKGKLQQTNIDEDFVLENLMFVLFFPHLDRIDIDKPLWDQRTFIGRFRHFAFVTDPRTCITSEADLDKAKILVEQYRYVFQNNTSIIHIQNNLNAKPII